MTGINDAEPRVLIGDTDGLIVLLQEDDSNHEKAVQIARWCVEQHAEVIFPLTAVVEVVTTVQRRLNNPPLAEIKQQTIEDQLVIKEIERGILKHASTLFNPFGSKQNTLFDAVVAMVARKYGATVIFSFDEWYMQIGLTLAATLLAARSLSSLFRDWLDDTGILLVGKPD
jgi:predicted nucleic acid-binding protein